MSRLLALPLLVLLTPACAPPTTEVPAVAPSVAPVAPVADVAEMHRARCGKCHVRVEPGARTRDAFAAALVRHRNRVHLTEAQWGALLDYLAPSRA